jgi:hypothetical protein
MLSTIIFAVKESPFVMTFLRFGVPVALAQLRSFWRCIILSGRDELPEIRCRF